MGLGKMVTDRLVSGQSIGSSIGQSISDKLKARATGIKQFFDPLNMVRAATGGSELATALFGRMVGRSTQDIKFFTGKSSMPKTYSVEPKAVSTYTPKSVGNKKTAELLKKLFVFMQTTHEEQKEHRETMVTYHQFQDNIRQDRHDELMEALIETTKEKRKADALFKKEYKKREQEYKNRIKKLEKELSDSQKMPSKMVPEGRPSKIVERPVERVATAPSAPATTARKVPRLLAPVIAGGAGALSIGEAIAKGESAKGSYNAANMGTRNNRIVPIKSKIDLEDMTIEEVIRRQSIPWGAPNENEKLFAVGKYQMIPSTLLDAVNTLNISRKEKFNGQMQEKLFNDYLLGIKRPAIVDYLNSKTDDPVLLKRALKQLSLEWASIADPDIPGGKTSHYGSGNRATLSVEEATAILKRDREKLQGRTLKEETRVPTVGESINDKSVDNAEMRKLMRQQALSVQQVIVTKNDTTVVKKQNSSSTPSKESNPLLQ